MHLVWPVDWCVSVQHCLVKENVDTCFLYDNLQEITTLYPFFHLVQHSGKKQSHWTGFKMFQEIHGR